jgi:hypothetical protein
MVDETALSDDTLEAIQNSSAILESIDASLMVPGKLEGLDWDAGVKVGDLVAYFNGHVVSIEHPEDNWTEEKIIPRCPEAKVLEAVSEAVAAGSVWIISGPASVWGRCPRPALFQRLQFFAVLRKASMCRHSLQRRCRTPGLRERRML